MTDDTPNIVHSGKSQSVLVDGFRFGIQIYLGEDEKDLILEGVDAVGASHVRDNRFASDPDARNDAIQELERHGAGAFMRGDEAGDVLPFRGVRSCPAGAGRGEFYHNFCSTPIKRGTAWPAQKRLEQARQGEGKEPTVQHVRLALEAHGIQILEGGQVATGPGVAVGMKG